MRKVLISVLCTICICFILTGCCINHEWQNATCIAPQKCTKCETVEGEALGHVWLEATCSNPKSCSICGAKEGQALGHNWTDATCIIPQTCSVCGEIGHEALGHTWIDASCTEAKACNICGEKEGKALGHNWIDATCIEAQTCSTCGKVEGDALGHTWIDATLTAPKTCTKCGATVGKALQPKEIAITGEPILKKGSSVRGWSVIENQSQSTYFAFPLDDCYQTASGVYVVSNGWVCKMFDNAGNGTPGQYALWSIGETGNPYKYIDGGEYDPVEGVHFWKLE